MNGLDPMISKLYELKREMTRDHVDMQFDISDEDFLRIAKYAHSLDVTFNDAVTILIAEVLSDLAIDELAESVVGDAGC